MTRFTACLLVAVLTGLNGCATFNRGAPPTATAPPAPATLPPGYVKTYVVFGQRYYVLESANGYDEQGIASWYGPKFHGRKTANGETYDMHGMSAAHKSLPLGTWVRVTNLSNQRVVDLRINDRGPFVDDRVIDLSFAAAKALGVVGPGTAPVHVSSLDFDSDDSLEATAASETYSISAETDGVATAIIDRPALIQSRPAPPPPEVVHVPAPAVADATTALPAPAEMPVTTSEPGYIQVASFGELDNANRLVTQLEQSGFNNVIIQALTVNSRLLHRVRLGPLISTDQLQDLLDRLSSMGLRGSRVVTR